MRGVGPDLIHFFLEKYHKIVPLVFLVLMVPILEGRTQHAVAITNESLVAAGKGAIMSSSRANPPRASLGLP